MCKHASLRRAHIVALMDWYDAQQLFWERSGSINCLGSENSSRSITQRPHNPSGGLRGVVWIWSHCRHKQKWALLCVYVQWSCGDGTASQEWGKLVSNCKGCIITSRFQRKWAFCMFKYTEVCRVKVFTTRVEKQVTYFHDALIEP